MNVSYDHGCIIWPWVYHMMIMNVLYDHEYITWPWMYHMIMNVSYDHECIIWPWVYHMTMDVSYDHGCIIWLWMYYMTMNVSYDHGCIIWPWMYHMTMDVSYDHGCIIWPWMYHITMNVSYEPTITANITTIKQNTQLCFMWYYCTRTYTHTTKDTLCVCLWCCFSFYYIRECQILIVTSGCIACGDASVRANFWQYVINPAKPNHWDPKLAQSLLFDI